MPDFDRKKEKNYDNDTVYNSGIESYRRMGPLFDLGNIVATGELVSVAERHLLPTEASPSVRRRKWLDNIRNPKLYLDCDDVGASDIMSLYRDIGDACEAQGQNNTAILLYEATLTVASSRPEVTLHDMLAVNEARDWLTARGIRQSNGEPYPVEAPRIKMLDKALGQRKIRNGGLKDGPAFEIALMSVLQYGQFVSEKEDVDNVTRMARTREDMPAQGMPSSEGTRVAHDVVYVENGKTYRIQAKFGPDTSKGYDPHRIIVIEELDMDQHELTEVLELLIQAYKGDPVASHRVSELAEKYRSRIVGSRTCQAKTIIRLANS